MEQEESDESDDDFEGFETGDEVDFSDAESFVEEDEEDEMDGDHDPNRIPRASFGRGRRPQAELLEEEEEIVGLDDHELVQEDSDIEAYFEADDLTSSFANAVMKARQIEKGLESKLTLIADDPDLVKFLKRSHMRYLQHKLSFISDVLSASSSSSSKPGAAGGGDRVMSRLEGHEGLSELLQTTSPVLKHFRDLPPVQQLKLDKYYRLSLVLSLAGRGQVQILSSAPPPDALDMCALN
eukprot:GILI01050108.1.p1 GENE.GILI01050108.1~~GILI01050108.1.p1  ORF type:complete len:239 (-),score=62.07 GILI01050108.1:97-813(-)